MNLEDRPIFEFLDRRSDIEMKHRNLPHWFQAGAAMFLTFRTADSLPKEVVDRWQRELEQWLRCQQLPTVVAQFATRKLMEHELRLLDTFSPSQRSEFKKLKDRIWHRSLDDCHGQCLLKNRKLALVVADSLHFFNRSKYDLESFVVMPNHVHAIVQFRAGFDLEVVSQSWLRYTAREINKLAARSGPFWQPEPFDHMIRSPEQFEYLQHYIADNPKKANLKDGEFLYWRV